MNIGLLGCGVVGGGILDFCAGREDLTVTKVLVRRPRPDLGALAVTDIADIVNDEAIGIVAEVMGGLHPAYEYICAALKAGKHVVTANKAVISAYYPELTGLARECGVSLRCTAAVGGGIPWLTNLERCKRLDSIPGVVPGNFEAGPGAGLCRGGSLRRHRRRRCAPEADHLRQHRL